MRSHKSWLVMVFAAVVMVGSAACDRSRDEAAPIDAQLEQELALALEGDTVPAVFEDTAIAAAEVEPPAPPAPEPVRQVPPRERAEPRPAPSRPEPVVRVEVETDTGSALEEVTREVEERPQPRMLTVPLGTTLDVSLDVELSTENNAAGDAFTATVQNPIVAPDGTVIIPAGASVRGRVTHVQKSGRVGETALLNVAFEAVSWGDSRYPLEAAVVQANPERVSRSSTAEQVGKVAVGAAAGALLGRVIGGKNRDAVKGAVVGAAAGTAIALGTADVDAVLKKGSLMVIRTERPLDVTVATF